MPKIPRIIVGAIQGRSGKTTFTLGLLKALKTKGIAVQPFKKGPDYIDPSWMSLASGIPCRNLDAFMMRPEPARKREFGILRAMGITDAGFKRMLAKEGLCYGIYSGVTVLVIYFVVQKILYYFLVHVYLYLHPGAFVSGAALGGILLLNVGICVGVALLSGRAVLREGIVEEIQE